MRTGRGGSSKSYIAPHGNGFKYVRGVPRDIQRLEGRRYWIKCLGNISRAKRRCWPCPRYEHSKRILTLRALAKGEGLRRSSAHEGQPRQRDDQCLWRNSPPHPRGYAMAEAHLMRLVDLGGEESRHAVKSVGTDATLRSSLCRASRRPLGLTKLQEPMSLAIEGA